MNSLKKMICLVLSLCMVFVLPISAATLDDEVQDPLAWFVPYIEDFYAGESEAYTIYGLSGSDITQEVLDATSDYAMQNDWEQVYQYYVHNVTISEYLQTGHYKTRALDVAKWGKKDVVVYNLKGTYGPDYMDYKTNAHFTVSGTIYYNPNTKIISSVSGTSVTNTYCEPFGIINGYTPYSYHSNYTGTFKATVYPEYEVIVGGVSIGTVKFQDASGVLEITPD